METIKVPYRKSERGKEMRRKAQQKYYQSEKGKEARLRFQEKRKKDPEYLSKQKERAKRYRDNKSANVVLLDSKPEEYLDIVP